MSSSEITPPNICLVVFFQQNLLYFYHQISFAALLYIYTFSLKYTQYSFLRIERKLSPQTNFIRQAMLLVDSQSVNVEAPTAMVKHVIVNETRFLYSTIKDRGLLLAQILFTCQQNVSCLFGKRNKLLKEK